MGLQIAQPAVADITLHALTRTFNLSKSVLLSQENVQGTQTTALKCISVNFKQKIYIFRLTITIQIKIRTVWDWRSTPTYCQLQSHVTRKLGQKSKIRPR